MYNTILEHREKIHRRVFLLLAAAGSSTYKWKVCFILLMLLLLMARVRVTTMGPYQSLSLHRLLFLSYEAHEWLSDMTQPCHGGRDTSSCWCVRKYGQMTPPTPLQRWILPFIWHITDVDTQATSSCLESQRCNIPEKTCFSCIMWQYHAAH